MDLSAIKKPNALSITAPELLAEWDYEKNAASPDDVAAGSHKKVFWKCACGNEWLAAPHQRTMASRKRDGKFLTGCAECARKRGAEQLKKTKLAQGVLLFDKYPDLLAEWDYQKNLVTPDQVTEHNNNKFWWKCRLNHSWQATASNRGHNASRCPDCNPATSRAEIYLYSECKSTFTNVLWRSKIDGKEVDIYLPDHKIAIEFDGEFWHREKTAKDQLKSDTLHAAGIQLIRIRSAKNMPAGGIDVVYPEEARMNYQEIANAMFDELAVLVPLPEVKAYAKNRLQLSKDLYNEIVSNLPAPPYELSLAAQFPEVVKQWDVEKNLPLTPELFTKASGFKMWWKCPEGHSYQAAIKNKVSKDSGCPDCYRALQAEHGRIKKIDGVFVPVPKKLVEPKIPKEKRPNARKLTTAQYEEKVRKFNPTLVVRGAYINSDQPIDIKCTACGNEWSPIAGSIINKGAQGCPKCARGRIALANLKDSEEFAKELALKNTKVKQIGVYVGNKQKLEVECLKCGKHWLATAGDLLAGHACMSCYGKAKKTNEQFIDDLSKVNSALEVLGKYETSKTPIEIRCKVCSHVWSTKPNYLLSGSGCPVCARNKKLIK